MDNFEPQELIFFYFLFGPKFKERYKLFFRNFYKFLDYACELKTTLYTLSFKKTKNIIDIVKQENVIIYMISDKLYELIIEYGEKIMIFDNFEEIYNVKDTFFLAKNEIQIELIISIIRYFIYENNGHYKDKLMTYSFIKYFQDIGFCFKIFCYLFVMENLTFEEKFNFPFYSDIDMDIRRWKFLKLIVSLSEISKISPQLLKLSRESAKIKDTIILGEKQFRNKIKMLNLPSKRNFELDDKNLELFFKNPYKDENKYKITKYFVICEDNSERKYLRKFKILSSKYGFAYLFIIYLKDKKILDIRENIKNQKSIIYISDDYELFEICKDNNERLKPYFLEILANKNKPKSSIKKI